MDTMFFLHAFLLALVGLSLAQKNTDSSDQECGPCDKSACPSDLSCRAETVPDRCSCCQVCSKVLGERCGGPANADGRCADDYICAGKSVYEPVQDEEIGQCVCTALDRVCGTDGVVYDNKCKLKMASYESVQNGQPAIEVDETDQLCSTVPVITEPPKNSILQVGSQSELSCEAYGRPIPDIIWMKDGEVLPGNHLNIATRKRNGPVKFAMTSWVLINVSPDDGGLYTCMASNSQGETESLATVVIGQKIADDVDTNQVPIEL
ncbi:insulin-like growth factor-binding protein 7 [Acanthaster planci]|uniref:Insulin-like growth factor-binding protein 7 n=1 Tax=Acanthaster planci TaxID=133434 RepID=A0A8B7YJH4_ACAPL|nr:insulin-like growth factor-binding protein 7 [Acanthaster planci]